MPVLRLLVALIVLGSTGALAQPTTLRVGPIEVARGERTSALVPIADGSDEGTEVPVTVVHGRGPGPVAALIAGNHGYEYAPILALQRLLHELDPASLAGSVILVHVAAMPSFLARTIYENPVDGKNLNRSYPGKPDGTSSERIAHFVTTEVIEKADFVLDLHSGDGNESLRPFVYMPVSGNGALDDETRELALAFGIDHIVVDRMGAPDPENAQFCDATAVSRGIPALTTESGYLGTRDETSVNRTVEGIRSVLRHYGMIPGRATPTEHPIFLEPTQVVTSPATGMLFPHVERGQTVVEGTLLATVKDFFGAEIARLRAPFAGVVLYIVATPPISEGEPVAMVGAPRP